MTRISDILSKPVESAEEFRRLRSWAATFNHRLTPGFRHDIFYDRRERWLGFAQHCTTPVYWTGWHPDNTPAETLAALQMLQAYSHMAYGMSYIIGDAHSPLAPMLPKMKMEKLGELWMGCGR
jgi:hypothetical protein